MVNNYYTLENLPALRGTAGAPRAKGFRSGLRLSFAETSDWTLLREIERVAFTLGDLDRSFVRQDGEGGICDIIEVGVGIACASVVTLCLSPPYPVVDDEEERVAPDRLAVALERPDSLVAEPLRMHHHSCLMSFFCFGGVRRNVHLDPRLSSSH